LWKDTFRVSWQKPGLPDFSLHNIPKRGKLLLPNLPNGYTMYQIAKIYSKWSKNIPSTSIQRHKQFTQIDNFGLKLYHLATLAKRVHS
jgi:hypothetical protein